MKDKGVRAIFLLLATLLVIGAIFEADHYVMARPAVRTKAYFAFYRRWHAYCPIKAAKFWPLALMRRFEPFVPVWVQVEPGVVMLLDPYDLISGAILETGEWEPGTWHKLKAHLPAGGTFIDVGAHIGWYSLNAAKAVGPRGRVVAIEPNRETLVMLRDNIRASGAGAVTLVERVACADSETTLTFYAARRANTGESSLSLANASQEGPPAASYQVRARRLDDMVREAGLTRVDVIKIDVEGAEYLVLKGAAETLDRYRPVLSVELFDEGLRTMGSSAQEVVAFLRSHGYAPRGEATESNVVFVPVAAP